MPPPAPAAPPPRRRRPASRFEGDIAIVELRSRLALAPDQLPEPPRQKRRRAVLAVIGRFGAVAMLAGACGTMLAWLSELPSAPAQPQAALRAETAMTVLPEAPSVLPEAPTGSVMRRADRAAQEAVGAALFSAADYASQVTNGVGTPPAMPAERPAPSSPEPRNATPAEAPAPPGMAVDRDMVGVLLARGRSYVAAGDIASARVVLRRAAEAGDSQAALTLGGTYDPIALKRMGVVNVAADRDQAREWYRKAAGLGSQDAPQRLEQLAQTDR